MRDDELLIATALLALAAVCCILVLAVIGAVL